MIYGCGQAKIPRPTTRTVGRHILYPGAILLLACGQVPAEDWPQFRGPNCGGVSTSKHSLPVEFSAKDKVRWSAKLGDGIGSPVIAKGRVFVTAMTAKQKFGVSCLDAGSGKELWSRA
jgi:outer membrane protein assembly factor BamB